MISTRPNKESFEKWWSRNKGIQEAGADWSRPPEVFFFFLNATASATAIKIKSATPTTPATHATVFWKLERDLTRKHALESFEGDPSSSKKSSAMRG